MSTQAILWDVGGPLSTEIEHERLIDHDIRVAFETAGLMIDDRTYDEAASWAVETFAPNAYRAIVWSLSSGDVELSRTIYSEVEALSHRRDLFDLRDGIPTLLAELRDRGVKLGLAANQPSTTIEQLDRFEIGRYFQHRGVSGTHGFRKPDVRLFLLACEELSVDPSNCVMVGDRIDNDIVPANALGMRTVLLRTGRHRKQQPRSWDEIPDVEVYEVESLRRALFRILDE